LLAGLLRSCSRGSRAGTGAVAAWCVFAFRGLAGFGLGDFLPFFPRGDFDALPVFDFSRSCTSPFLAQFAPLPTHLPFVPPVKSSAHLHASSWRSLVLFDFPHFSKNFFFFCCPGHQTLVSSVGLSSIGRHRAVCDLFVLMAEPFCFFSSSG